MSKKKAKVNKKAAKPDIKKALREGKDQQTKMILEMLGLDIFMQDKAPDQAKLVEQEPLAIIKKPSKFPPRPKLTKNERKSEKWQFVLRFPPELKASFMAHCKENGIVYRRLIVKLIKDYMGKQK